MGLKLEYVDKSREDLASLLIGAGVEVGTEQGAFAEIILKYANQLTCVDPWEPYAEYKDHVGKEKLNRFREITRDRLKRFGDRVTLVPMYSMEAVKLARDDFYDFVYIDANHSYKYVLEDITEWTKKVKPGGIVAGDDYMHMKGRPGQFEVIKAVNEYAEANDKSLIVYQLGKPRQWMFIK